MNDATPAHRPKKTAFARVSLQTTMEFLGQTNFAVWRTDFPPRLPSAFLLDGLARLTCFNISNDAGKSLFIDVLFMETLPHFPNLRVWKNEPLEADAFFGVPDYLVAKKRAYMDAPVLCVVQAKKDNFEQGAALCVAQMAACQSLLPKDCAIDVFGIVSNGQAWQFYCLNPPGTLWESETYALQSLPELLGALDYVCAECAKNAP